MKTRLKKALLSLLLVMLLGMGATGIYFSGQINERKDALAEFILTHPESAAVAAYTFDENGDWVDDGDSLFFQADSPLVLASTMKIAVLVAYADAVVQGELDPNERVAVAEVERYYLPFTDGGAHAQGLASLGLAADEAGFAQDQSATISLDDLARIMIHTSGNAETDYLIERLGTDKIASVLTTASLESHTPIHSTLGVALALCAHEGSLYGVGTMDTLIGAVSAGETHDLDNLADLYMHDPAWRARQIEFMVSGEYVQALEQATWADQVNLSQLFPKATAREYARMMARIASGKLISPEVSASVQQVLESVPSDWPLRLLYYDRFGAKDGVTAGVLTLASYATPKHGPQAGRGRVVVIFANSMPYDLWASQLQFEGHYLLQTDLASAVGAFHKLAGHAP